MTASGGTPTRRTWRRRWVRWRNSAPSRKLARRDRIEARIPPKARKYWRRKQFQIRRVGRGIAVVAVLLVATFAIAYFLKSCQAGNVKKPVKAMESVSSLEAVAEVRARPGARV